MQRLIPSTIYLILLAAISWLSNLLPEFSAHKNHLLIAISMVYFQLLAFWGQIEERDAIGASCIFVTFSTATMYLALNSEIALFKGNYLEIIGINGIVLSLLLIFWRKK